VEKRARNIHICGWCQAWWRLERGGPLNPSTTSTQPVCPYYTPFHLSCATTCIKVQTHSPENRVTPTCSVDLCFPNVKVVLESCDANYMSIFWINNRAFWGGLQPSCGSYSRISDCVKQLWYFYSFPDSSNSAYVYHTVLRSARCTK
jgi:hypothetical protein